MFIYNYTTRHDDVWGSGGIDPRIPYFTLLWRWVVKFTLRPLHPYHSCGSQSRSGRNDEM